MSFTTPTFLFAFLPISILLYYIVRGKARPVILMIISFAFYGLCDIRSLPLFLFSILINYLMCLLLNRKYSDRLRKGALAVLLCWNIGLLFYYKYYVFCMKSLDSYFHLGFIQPEIIMPLGISFFTFKAISVCVDIYREKSPLQKNFLHFALYLSFFPQVSVGPIAPYHSFQSQIFSPTIKWNNIVVGSKKIILGLSKKLLLADTLVSMVNIAFATDPSSRTILMSWMGCIGYSLQLYFDFSGYSDIAIGIGYLFGYYTDENFDFPYISCSITEFWRRWHISLGRWFRDYVYFPLGGSRRGNVYLNLFVVFLLTGIWHGAAWNFIIWGLWHGMFRIIEYFFEKHNTNKIAAPVLLKWLLTMVIVGVGWVLFKSDSLGSAISYIGSMLGFHGESLYNTEAFFYFRQNVWIIVIGFISSFPIIRCMKMKLNNTDNQSGFLARLQSLRIVKNAAHIMVPVIYIALLIISISFAVSGTYQSFIYFKF